MTLAHKVQVAVLCVGYVWLGWAIWQSVKEWREIERARKARIRARG